jgi:hypothetical protein
LVVREGQVCECNLCGHQWLPRLRNPDGTLAEPKCCGKCKSPLWNRPSTRRTVVVEEAKNIQRSNLKEVTTITNDKNLDIGIRPVAYKEDNKANDSSDRASSKLYSKFVAKSNPRILLTVLSPMKSVAEQITFYVSHEELVFANCKDELTIMSMTRCPASSFKEFSFRPSVYTPEHQGGTFLEFAVDTNQVLKALESMVDDADISIFATGDDYLHLEQGEVKYGLPMLKSKHVRLTAPDFAYVAKLELPSSFIHQLLGDMEVVADCVNIIVKNSSEILFTGVSKAKPGFFLRKITPARVKENDTDVILSSTRGAQCTLDLALLKPIVESIRTARLSIELSVAGPVRIITGVNGTTASVYLGNIGVKKELEK